jgi:outer membrane lipoprotein SlyB
MLFNKFFAALTVIILCLTGCATGTQTSNAYSGAQTRQVSVVKTGVVTYVKDITISNKSGVGAAGGAALGGVAGASNGRSGSSQQAGSAIAGAIIGGIIGQVADSKLNELQGQEIGILLSNGVEISIAQEIDPTDGKLATGDKVRVLTAATGITRVSRQ